MCKKLCVTTLAVVIGLGLLSQTKVGRHIFSLGGLTWNNVSSAVGDSVPLDVEIARIGQEIENLNSDINHSYDILAKQKTDVKLLGAKVEALEKQLASDLDNAKTLKAMLDQAGDSEKVSFKGRQVKVDDLGAEFTASWNLFKANEATLEHHKQILAQKQELMEATAAKTKQMETMQDSLRAQLLSLKTKLEKVRVAETVSPVQIDDSRLADIKKDIANLEKRIEEKAQRLELEQQRKTAKQSQVKDKLEQSKAQDDFDARFGNKEKVAGNK
jgi:chromosome segregation ATPase